MSEMWANPEEIISVLVWLWDRPGHRQEAAVRPMGERRGRNHELDEAHRPNPPAETGRSKRVYLNQPSFGLQTPILPSLKIMKCERTSKNDL